MPSKSCNFPALPRAAQVLQFFVENGGRLKGFKQFLMRGNVIDLAVAVVIGAAFGSTVSSFVKDLLTPLIAAIGGNPDFSNLFFTINGSRLMYGSFINALLSFLLVSAAVYYVIVLPMSSLGKKRAASPSTRPCPECLSEIPLQARRCAHCTSEVRPVSTIAKSS
jgi:large conductance mechanosensitive channel